MKEFICREKLMGTAFSLGVVCENSQEANEYFRLGIEEIRRIERLFSEYDAGSVTSQINQLPKEKPFKVEKEVFEMIKRSRDISKLTNGCFDITAGGLKKIYSFQNKNFEFPSDTKIATALASVGIEKFLLDESNRTVTKLTDSLLISFNAIAKGYASDMVSKLWQRDGLLSGFINASGDLSAFGSKADGSSWKVGIADPTQKKEPIIFVPLTNQSIATSGDYEQYFMYKGSRYSHNINPHNGLPLRGLQSVSIVSPSAELSDALATAVYVMGLKKGIKFVNQLPQTFAVIVDENNQIHFSEKIRYEKNTL